MTNKLYPHTNKEQKMKNVFSKINANKGPIIKRTLIITVGVVGVTLAAGFFRSKSPDALVEAVVDAV